MIDSYKRLKKQQYRKLALKYHPDKNLGNEAAAKEIFVEVGNASDFCAAVRPVLHRDRVQLYYAAGNGHARQPNQAPPNPTYAHVGGGGGRLYGAAPQCRHADAVAGSCCPSSSRPARTVATRGVVVVIGKIKT